MDHGEAGGAELGVEARSDFTSNVRDQDLSILLFSAQIHKK